MFLNMYMWLLLPAKMAQFSIWSLTVWEQAVFTSKTA